MLWLFRTLLMIVAIIVVTLAVAFGPLFLQDQPSLQATRPPAPEDVATTRRLVRDIRAAAGVS